MVWNLPFFSNTHTLLEFERYLSARGYYVTSKKKCSVEGWKESIIVPIYKNGDKTE
jgi:hypothetical protein